MARAVMAIDQVRQAVAAKVGGVFGADQPRIDHAFQVLAYAEELMAGQPVDATVVIAAALLHDIGIAEAERKHGSAEARFQELEGPPIARRLMEELGFEARVIEHVCRIVANHHSASGIDTAEFRVIWDADWLVNIPGMHPTMPGDEMERLIGRVFKTGAGTRKARELFLRDIW